MTPRVNKINLSLDGQKVVIAQPDKFDSVGSCTINYFDKDGSLLEQIKVKDAAELALTITSLIKKAKPR